MPRLPLLLVLCLLLTPGCGSDSGDPTAPSGNPVAGATLAVDRAGTFEPVTVQGLPAPVGAARAEAYLAALAAEGADEIAIELQHYGESWFFVAPPHPVTPGAGGAFEVRIRSGSNESPAHAFTVDALPAAPGAFADMVAKMREHFDLAAAEAGTSLAELQATSAAEVADELLPLKLAQSYLDSDLDEHDLTDLAANTDGFLSAQEVDLLDRSFGFCDFEQYLQLQIDELQALSDLTSLPLRVDRAGRRACIDVSPTITTAPELAQAMIRSRVAEIGADPNSEAGQILGKGGKVLTGLGFVPRFGRITAVAGISLSAASAAMGLIAGVNPTHFTKIEAVVDEQEFNEDSTEHATWKNVWVTANSNGWYADQFIATSVINLIGGYLSDYELAKIADSDVLRNVFSVELGAAANLLFQDRGVIEFCPGEWRIDISSPLYCTAAALQHRFTVDIEAQEARPAEVGTDVLRVAAQAAQFGGRSISRDFPMEVRQIQVVCTPDEVVVREPGQDVPITATIANADLTTLRWTPEQGAWNDGLLGSDTNDGTTRTLATPASPDDYPFFVRVESLSRNGLRASGEPPRIGYAKLVLDAPEIVVSPGYACITPGESQQFTAAVSGIENYTVVWGLVEGYGSINQSGLFQSLSGGTSSNRVAAWLEEFPAVGDTVSIDASACNCSLAIEITGDATWSRESSQVAYTVANFGELFYQFFFDLGSDGPPLISASLAGTEEVPAPEPGQTGSWKAGFGYFSGSETWSSIWDDPKIPLPGVTLTITELTETQMIGRFTGNAFQLNENGEIASIVGVDVQFRAGYWGGTGGGWPCE